MAAVDAAPSTVRWEPAVVDRRNMPNVIVTNDHIAAVAALRQSMTREQLAAAMIQADIDDFHAHEAANAPQLPTLDEGAWAALKTHLSDGAGQPNPQAEIIAVYVALARDDQRAWWLATLATIKSAKLFVRQADIDAAVAALVVAEPPVAAMEPPETIDPK